MISSFALSKALGHKEHRHLYATICKYRNELLKLGDITILETKGKTGRPSKKYILNDGQALFVISQSRYNKENALRLVNSSNTVLLQRAEPKYLDIIESIAYGFQNDIHCVRQYKICSFNVDLAVFVGNPIIENIVCIVEYDEISHNSRKTSDSVRQDLILKGIYNNVSWSSDLKQYGFYIIRIKEGNELSGINGFTTFLNSLIHFSASETDSIEKWRLKLGVD